QRARLAGVRRLSRQRPRRLRYLLRRRLRRAPAAVRLEFPSQAVYGRHACVTKCNETGSNGCPYCTGVGHLHWQGLPGKGQTAALHAAHRRIRQHLVQPADVRAHGPAGESPVEGHRRPAARETDSAAEGLPLTQFSKEVRQLSQAMLDYHAAEQAKRTEARILRQRQVLHAVPVTQVDYTWRGRTAPCGSMATNKSASVPIWRAPAAPCCK
uniref:DUF721 domain-containing protein n=1 Tax=Macrostomum lignano TaxID=282301 RepID=A0A1I8HCU2_9PLAT